MNTTSPVSERADAHDLGALPMGRCPICRDVTEEISCYLAFERGILDDLREARFAGSDDAEVLEADAAKVRRHIDGLVALAARGARR